MKVIKLVTGEEIIGIVQDGRDVPDLEDGYTHDNLIFVTSPLKITCTYDPQNRTHSIYLSDWVPAIGEDSLPIDKNKILTLGRPTQELEEHYFELMIASQLANEALSQEPVEESEDTKDLEKKLTKMLKNHKFDDDDFQ